MPPAVRQGYASEAEMWDEADVDIFILDPNLATYSHLDRILKSGYLDSRGYKLVARFPGERTDILVYQRQDR
jgi:hypothetical protein